MGFFSVLAAGSDSPKFDVLKFDANLWILPGFPGRRVVFCDIGLKVAITSSVQSREKLGLRLGVPFRIEDSVTDLAHRFYGDARTANLVFGNSADAPRKTSSSVYEYDDGDGRVSLLEIDMKTSEVFAVGENSQAYTVYSVVSEQPVEEGEEYYLRVRFRVADTGRAWSWQRIGQRRSFAIADLRVHEFRDLPVLRPEVNFERLAIPLAQVNFFVVVSSRLKEQRKSPEPRYVRPLERHVWENYLGRRLSRRRGESFLIYYWRKEPVNESSPFRAFLEVERRRPTAARFALIAAGVSIVGFVLVSPTVSLEASLLVTLSDHIVATVATFVGAGLVYGALRLAVSLVPHLPAMRRWIARFEDRHFRVSKD
ncbi:hypothetical protein ACNI3K_08880 [Demequina sp. SO4-13]|uniref:hypothetical protein n=1 Tax=Demequina sp. SO4-13 TaxID=3401027 RepID=UPI003AF58848